MPRFLGAHAVERVVRICEGTVCIPHDQTAVVLPPVRERVSIQEITIDNDRLLQYVNAVLRHHHPLRVSQSRRLPDVN